MTNNFELTGPGIEKRLAAVIKNRGNPKDQVLNSIKNLPNTVPFGMKSTWTEIACDTSLEDWRRVEAYKIVLNRCLTYPCTLEYFIKDAITPWGIDKNQIVDVTMGQAFPRKIDEKWKRSYLILMVNLPILTPIGPVSVYFAVERSTNLVEVAAIHPESEF